MLLESTALTSSLSRAQYWGNRRLGLQLSLGEIGANLDQATLDALVHLQGVAE